MPQIVALAVAVLALFLSAFMSGSEIAFFSLTPETLDELDDTPENQRIRTILSAPERLLATILIGNNLVNVTIVVLCNFALGPIFSGMSEVMSFILQTVLLTFLILLFGEILPKLLANNNPLRWAHRAVGPLAVLQKLVWPLSSLLVKSTYIVNRVVTKKHDNISTDELSQALEITDVAEGENKEMLEGILKFGDTTASEIMTPRVDITDIDITWDFEHVLDVIRTSGYSRLPVYSKTQDDIRGVLYSRDLLPYIGPDNRLPANFEWQALIREPYFVPESRMIDDLLEDFRKLKKHIAIVVDEFGGTQGVVTLEDVLEEIVGDINDEYDEEEKTYKELGNDTYIFEGRTLLNDFFRVTGLDENDYAPVIEDCETLAGMLLSIKGDFPKEKEALVYGRCRFLILDIEHHRITSVRVKVMPDIQQA
ncbi:MAG: gliding motility-associated protein GldE [Muribaculaceae bacterium]|nr:gliding motility-associated protein GldE [Muribaculaceae bacterium]MDE6832548.1 gliding motility-associated protein GldE [Muribaculaceae bacterium]